MSFLNSPLNTGFKITVKQAVRNCKRLTRRHRRNLARRLFGMGQDGWRKYIELETHVDKIFV